MDPILLHRRSLEAFAERLSRVADDQWTAATPCEDWDVRALVDHVVSGTLWVAPLLSGMRIDEVTWLDGDVLGDDPVAAFKTAAEEAQAAFDQPGAAMAPVHASFPAYAIAVRSLDVDEADVAQGFPGVEYAHQRHFDMLVHAWDLAAATGGDTDLPGDLVAATAAWFDEVEGLARELGAIGDPVPLPPGADAQTHLLARLGRSPDHWRTT